MRLNFNTFDNLDKVGRDHMLYTVNNELYTEKKGWWSSFKRVVIRVCTLGLWNPYGFKKIERVADKKLELLQKK